MKKKEIITLIVVIALTLIITGVGSYAFFTSTVTGNTTAHQDVVTAGSMSITYADGAEVSLENAIPGDTVTKLFSVTNTGNVATNYDVYLSEVNNQFVDQTDLAYSLVSTDGGYSTSSDVQIPSASGKIVSSQTIAASATHTYTLTIKFLAKDEAQDDNQGKAFSAKLQVNEYAIYRSDNLATDLLAVEGGTTAIAAKTAPDFTKNAPVVTAYKDNGFSDTESTYSLSTTLQGNYITYADAYTFDTATGLYSLTNAQVGKYGDIYSSLAGKYVVDYYPNSSSTARTSTGLTYIYKIVEAPYNASASVTIKYNKLVSTKDNTAAIVSYDPTTTGMFATTDDYGASYYYRGAVTNNNVLFGGFCWKVIRVNGNGTTRMIYNGTQKDTYTSTALTQGEYLNVTNDATYAYTYDTGTNQWTSTNKTDSATGTITFKVGTAGDYAFNYTVSSEADYDKATLYVDDVSKVEFI